MTKPKSNADFLRALFGDEWEDIPVSTGASWGVRPAGKAVSSFLPMASNYYCVSIFNHEGGRFRRKKEIFKRQNIFVVDDIGTKLDSYVAEAMFPPPTYKLETSPGNFQWGFKIEGGCDDMRVMDAIVDATVSHELLNPSKTDPGMASVTRVVRLPFGANEKNSTKAANGGKPWPHVLHEWAPSRAYTIKVIAEAVGADISEEALDARKQGPMGGPPTQEEIDGDFILKLFRARGMIVDEIRNDSGFITVECPWADNHTDPRREAGYRPGLGGFKCHHGGCLNKTMEDLHAWAAEVETPEEKTERLAPLFPPIDDAELEVILAEALALPKLDRFERMEDRTDVGNANMLRRMTAGNLRYVSESRLWIFWDGLRWRPDRTGSTAQQAAIAVSRDLYEARAAARRKAADPKFEDEADKYKALVKSLDKALAYARSERGISNMLKIAGKLPAVEISLTKLDTNRDLLGVPNGVVDLCSGELAPIGRDEFVTKHTAVEFDPDAKAPLWERFVAEITGLPLAVKHDEEGEVIPSSVGRYKPRPELALYLQKLVGYCLTGWTVEQALFFMIGDGSNGKSVFWDIVAGLLGDYAVNVAVEVLMVSEKGGAGVEAPSPAKARLAGARLALSAEVKGHQKLDATTIKNITGDARMTARFLHKDVFEFDITAKHVVLANQMPPLDHLDEATKGRIQSAPHDRRWNRPGVAERNPLLPDGDKDLTKKLRAEAKGILAWAVRGAKLYFRDGLTPPPCVAEKTTTYLLAQDPVGRWLQSLDACAPSKGSTATELLASLKMWVDGQKGDSFLWDIPESPDALGRALKKRGHIATRFEDARRYALRPPRESSNVAILPDTF